MQIKHAVSIFWMLAAGSGAAFAQSPPAPATPPQQTAPATRTPAGCAAAGVGGWTVGQSNQPLGDKLAKSNGVLCPPTNVDPEMRAPTPDAGTTPVVPPPGSPGGNPNVQPK